MFVDYLYYESGVTMNILKWYWGKFTLIITLFMVKVSLFKYFVHTNFLSFQVYKNKRQAPVFSFGIRHSTYLAPLIVDAPAD